MHARAGQHGVSSMSSTPDATTSPNSLHQAQMCSHFLSSAITKPNALQATAAAMSDPKRIKRVTKATRAPAQADATPADPGSRDQTAAVQVSN